MPIRSLPYVCCFLLSGAFSAPVWAQDELTSDQPLSVIDWVRQNPDQPAITSVAMPAGEPPVADSGLVPTVDVTRLSREAARIIGLVPAEVTGLPTDLWHNSDPETISVRVSELPDFRLPAAQALLFTALLTEAQGPGNDSGEEDLFTLARVAALQRFGALDPALALIEQADVTRDKAHFAAYMDLALLTGEEWTACRILSAQPHLSPGIGHRIFCAARQGDWATAALLFDTSRALSVISREETALLDRFLHPEYFDGLAPLRPPAQITPLMFRLHETIGEPLPTRFLPRAYAVADLSDLVGWKAQLEAAERLAKTGALPDNRLIGLYTERLPAASGGIWDRVEAIQQFDTALNTRSEEAVSKTLPGAWAAMQAAELETAFAGLFHERLERITLTGSAAEIAQTLTLLSNDFQTVEKSADTPLLTAIAAGDPTGLSSRDPFEQAVIDGFKPDAARDAYVALAKQGKFGEAILRTLVLLEEGADGDAGALSEALGTLRELGFEDTVRRASLQILLLDRFGA